MDSYKILMELANIYEDYNAAYKSALNLFLKNFEFKIRKNRARNCTRKTLNIFDKYESLKRISLSTNSLIIIR
mgnify:CR=1 FL=1